MSKARRCFWAILAVGAGARLLSLYLEWGGYHPDAIFQYLEPAYWHQLGYGSTSWEWTRGARTWILPALNGAWLSLLETFGLHDGRLFHTFVRLQSVLWSLLLVPAAYRIAWMLALPSGTSVGESGYNASTDANGSVKAASANGLGAAAACALLPALVYYAPHTISEIPAMTLTAWGYVYWCALRKRHGPPRRNAFLLGLLLMSAAVVRPSTVVLGVLPAVDLLVRRRFGSILWGMLGTLPPLAILAVVDWSTWGLPFHSVIEWYEYNFVEGEGNRHGVSPTGYYWTWMSDGFGFAIWIFAGLVVVSLRRYWPMVLGAAVPLFLLSRVGHKEDRFLLVGVWPFLAICAGAGAVILGRTVARLVSRGSALARRLVGRATEGLRRPERLSMTVAGAVFGVWLIPGYWGLVESGPAQFTGMFDLVPPREAQSLRWGLFDAQRFVGQQPTVTGMLVGNGLHLMNSYIFIGRNVPQAVFNTRLVENPIFDWILIRLDRPGELRWLEERGWEQVEQIRGVIVLHRSRGELISPEIVSELEAGGVNGEPLDWFCPPGSALAEVDVDLQEEPIRIIGRVRPRCRWMVPREEEDGSRGSTVGPRLGLVRSGSTMRLSCPADQFVVGMVGRAGGYLDRLGLVCAGLEAIAAGQGESAGDLSAATSRTEAVGGDGGEPFERLCPAGSVVAGFGGRGGQVVDFLSLSCVRAR